MNSPTTLFISCALAGLVVPIPEDVPLLLAGLALSSNPYEAAATFAAAFFGVLVRDMLSWGVGAVVGARLARGAWVPGWFASPRIDQARTSLAAKGGAAVFAGRFLVGARVPTFIAAGLANIPLRTFLLWDVPGLLVVLPITIGVGRLGGPPVVAVLQQALPWARAIVTALLVGAIAWWWFRPRASPPLT